MLCLFLLAEAPPGYLVLLDILLLDRLEVGPQVHGALVLGSQQSSHHLVSRHSHLPQRRLLELPSEVLHLQLQLVDLKFTAKTNTAGKFFIFNGQLFEVRLHGKANFHAMKVLLFSFLFNQSTFLFSLKNIDTTAEDDLKSRQVAYVFVVFVHFGFTVISLLIHHVDFGVELFAQSLEEWREERGGESC